MASKKKSKTKEPETITGQLREAITASGKSRYAISKLAGVSQANLLRFMAGAELRSDSVDKLCKALRLKLTPMEGDHDDGQEAT